MADELLDELIRELGDGGDNFVLNKIRTSRDQREKNQPLFKKIGCHRTKCRGCTPTQNYKNNWSQAVK